MAQITVKFGVFCILHWIKSLLNLNIFILAPNTFLPHMSEKHHSAAHDTKLRLGETCWCARWCHGDQWNWRMGHRCYPYSRGWWYDWWSWESASSRERRTAKVSLFDLHLYHSTTKLTIYRFREWRKQLTAEMSSSTSILKPSQQPAHIGPPHRSYEFIESDNDEDEGWHFELPGISGLTVCAITRYRQPKHFYVALCKYVRCSLSIENCERLSENTPSV